MLFHLFFCLFFIVLPVVIPTIYDRVILTRIPVFWAIFLYNAVLDFWPGPLHCFTSWRPWWIIWLTQPWGRKLWAVVLFFVFFPPALRVAFVHCCCSAVFTSTYKLACGALGCWSSFVRACGLVNLLIMIQHGMREGWSTPTCLGKG